VAFLYPDRRELVRAIQRLVEHGFPPDHAMYHGGTVSVYLEDPDGNDIELYYDRPREHWFDAEGRLVLKADHFDFREILDNPDNGGG
jgi:catechol 2,3-dioxygenase